MAAKASALAGAIAIPNSFGYGQVAHLCRMRHLLIPLLLVAAGARAQTDPCAEQARQNHPALGLTADSLYLTALRPAGPCRLVAEGRYKGRTLLALGNADGSLTDTLAIPGDSSRMRLLAWGAGAIRLRLGTLESGLSLLYHPFSREAGLGQAAAITILLQPLAALQILPPPRIDMLAGEVEQYANIHSEVLAAGSGRDSLCLLVRRRKLACRAGMPGCCRPEIWHYWLVWLPADAQGLPGLAGARVLALQNDYVPAPPAPACQGHRAPEPELMASDLASRQPIVPIEGGWLCHTGSTLLRVYPKKLEAVPLPPKTRPSQVFVDVPYYGAGQLGTPQAFYRTGGLLRQADERQAFRLRERWVVSGTYEVALPSAGRPWQHASYGTLPLQPDELAFARPLAFFGGYWWLAGYARKKSGLTTPGAFGR